MTIETAFDMLRASDQSASLIQSCFRISRRGISEDQDGNIEHSKHTANIGARVGAATGVSTLVLGSEGNSVDTVVYIEGNATYSELPDITEATEHDEEDFSDHSETTKEEEEEAKKKRAKFLWGVTAATGTLIGASLVRGLMSGSPVDEDDAFGVAAIVKGGAGGGSGGGGGGGACGAGAGTGGAAEAGGVSTAQ
jgi:hypothetical protein